MKKFFAALAVAIAMCFVLAGCKDSSEQPPAADNGNQTVEPEQLTEEKPQKPDGSEQPEQEEITKMYLTVNGNKIEVTLAENSAVEALVEILKQGDVVYTANDYGGFEKVGSLGHTLPHDDTYITTEAGDVILYSGNQIVLFYGSNTWEYTRLGKIDGYSVDELRTLLGAGKGSVQVTISLK